MFRREYNLPQERTDVELESPTRPVKSRNCHSRLRRGWQAAAGRLGRQRPAMGDARAPGAGRAPRCCQLCWVFMIKRRGKALASRYGFLVTV